MVSGGGRARLWRAGVGVAAVLLGRDVTGRRRLGVTPLRQEQRTVVRSPCGWSTLAGEAVRSAAPRAAPKYGAHTTAANPRPNVMVVMIDDMRWDEVRYLPNVQRYVARPRAAVHQLVLAVPAVLPGARVVPARAVLPQPPRLYHEAPYGFGSIDDSRTIATALAAGRLPDGAWSASTSTGTARCPRGSPGGVDRLRARWLDRLDGRAWRRSGRTARRTAGNTYNYFAFTQNINGRTVAHTGQYSSTVIADEVLGLVGA